MLLDQMDVLERKNKKLGRVTYHLREDWLQKGVKVVAKNFNKRTMCDDTEQCNDTDCCLQEKGITASELLSFWWH